uniref:Uncharacterized protein n=1 Tax=Cacopsylla melanoneura TaxID=428564 RepID=A0A8D9E529_9HEMI
MMTTKEMTIITTIRKKKTTELKNLFLLAIEMAFKVDFQVLKRTIDMDLVDLQALKRGSVILLPKYMSSPLELQTSKTPAFNRKMFLTRNPIRKGKCSYKA